MIIQVLEFKVTVKHLVPWQSLLVELLHEWVWVEVSTFHTPGLRQSPLKNIMAPIMAGTPVV